MYYHQPRNFTRSRKREEKKNEEHDKKAITKLENGQNKSIMQVLRFKKI